MPVTLAPRFQGQPAWFRWVGPYVLIDQVFALTQVKDLSDDADFRRYYLAAGFMFCAGGLAFILLDKANDATSGKSARYLMLFGGIGLLTVGYNVILLFMRMKLPGYMKR